MCDVCRVYTQSTILSETEQTKAKGPSDTFCFLVPFDFVFRTFSSCPSTDGSGYRLERDRSFYLTVFSKMCKNEKHGADHQSQNDSLCRGYVSRCW